MPQNLVGRGVRVTQIRNATLHVDYAGTRFLVDPLLSEPHAWPGFEGTVNSEERNALVQPLHPDPRRAARLRRRKRFSGQAADPGGRRNRDPVTACRSGGAPAEILRPAGLIADGLGMSGMVPTAP